MGFCDQQKSWPVPLSMGAVQKFTKFLNDAKRDKYQVLTEL